MNPFLSPSLLSLQLAALRRKKALFLRLIQRYRQTRRRERNYYQKPVNAQRENRGEFMRIVQHYRSADPKEHRAYFRMSMQQFDDIVDRIRAHIRHEPTFIDWCTGMQVPKRVSCAIPVSVEAIVASKFKLVWWRQLGGNLETFKKLPHDSYSGGNQFPPVRKRFIVIHTGCGNGFLQFPRLPPVSTKYELGLRDTFPYQ